MYEVRIRRARGGWEERERLRRLQVSDDRQSVLLKTVDPPGWTLPGALAERAFQLWRQAGQDFPEPRGDRFRQRADQDLSKLLTTQAEPGAIHLKEAGTAGLNHSDNGSDSQSQFSHPSPPSERTRDVDPTHRPVR